eukprot:jgi/Galph1/3069/GphlegSOOS_G1752.1
MVENKVKELLRSVGKSPLHSVRYAMYQTIFSPIGASHLYPKLEELGVDEYSFFNLTASDLSLIGIKDEQQQALLLQLISKQQQSLPTSEKLTFSPANKKPVKKDWDNVESQRIENGSKNKISISSRKTRNTRYSVMPRASQNLENNLYTIASPNSEEMAGSDGKTKNCTSTKHRYSYSMPTSKLSNNEVEIDQEETNQQDSRIMVCVRKRPISKKEQSKNDPDVISTIHNTLQVYEPKLKVDLTKYTEVHEFSFDKVFNEEANNMTVYKSCTQPLIHAIFKGYKVTCFAYGQTGAGKTFTMMGTKQEPGLYTLALRDIFRLKQKPEYSHLGVFISFFEIYGSKLFDLLNGRERIECREDAKQRVRVIGLQQRHCNNAEDVLQLLEEGAQARSTGVTGANADSSRSHAILEIQLKYMSDSPNEQSKDEDPSLTFGKLSFIDLAGSERAADTTQSDRQTRLEGAEINKSLLALKECIRALDQNHHHTPFRGSKLTIVLKDSFVSTDSKTVMIANISPSASNCEHTLNTLRYADRVKELRKDGSGSGRRQSEIYLNSASSLDIVDEESHQQGDEKRQKEKEGESNDQKRMLRRTNERELAPQQEETKLKKANLRSKSLIPNPTKILKEEKQCYPSLPENSKFKESRLSFIPQPSSNRSENRRKSISCYATSEPNKLPASEKQESRRIPSSLVSSKQLNSSGLLQLDSSNLRHSSDRTEDAKLATESAELSTYIDPQVESNDDTDVEESLILAHRQHIDDTMELVKQEMALLQMTDHPDASFGTYVEKLEQQLERKLVTIQKLQKKLFAYRSHITI